MVTRIIKFFTGMQSLLKTLVFINLFMVGLIGSIWAVLIVLLFLFILLLLNSQEHGINSGPFFPLIFCGLAVLIVIPDGTESEVEFALYLMARILALSYISIFIGYIFNQRDFLVIGDLFGLKSNKKILFIIIPIFLPTALSAIQNVLIAQQSRGLKLNIKSLLKRETFEAMIIPYVVTILKRALELWITVNLKPWDSYIIKKQKIKFTDILITCMCLSLWILSF